MKLILLFLLLTTSLYAKQTVDDATWIHDTFKPYVMVIHSIEKLDSWTGHCFLVHMTTKDFTHKWVKACRGENGSYIYQWL